MSEIIIDESVKDMIKKAKNGAELVDNVFAKIYKLDVKRGYISELAEIMHINRDVLYRLHRHGSKKPFTPEPESYDQICEAISKKLGIDSNEVGEMIKHVIIRKGSKSEKEQKILSDKKIHWEKLRNQLKDDVTYIVHKLGYQWKEHSLCSSENTVVGDVQFELQPGEWDIFEVNELERVYGIGLLEENYKDVMLQVADMELEETELIILCCDRENIFSKAKEQENILIKKNIWIKMLGTDNAPELKAYCKGKENKDNMKKLIKRLSK